MLKTPPVMQIDDVAIYEDDTVAHRFYLVPSMPSIVLDKNGRPVFLLVIQHFSLQGREENPDLPRGAGYMQFDVEFAVSPQQQETIREQLQERVNGQHRGRGRAPTVELSAPMLSGGTVKMNTTQSEHLTSARLAEVDASLAVGSRASFNLDLTEEGVSFMKGLLIDEAGEGNVDLTPISINYSMRMMARLPPVTVTVKGDSERVHETLLTAQQTNADNGCTPGQIETMRDSGTSSSTLRESGAVTVVTDKGDATMPEESVRAIEEYAMDLFDTMVSERFLVPAEADDTELGFEDEEPLPEAEDEGWAATLHDQPNYGGSVRTIAESTAELGATGPTVMRRGGYFVAGAVVAAAARPAPVRSVKLRSGHSATLYSGPNFSGKTLQLNSSTTNLSNWWVNRVRSIKVKRAPEKRLKTRKTVNHSEMHLEIKMERSQVVEWPVGAQATLSTFFSGMSAEEMKRFVVEITEDAFKTLQVRVKAYANFEEEVTAVEVQLEYVAKKDDGERYVETKAYRFDKDDTDEKKFDPAVIGGERHYRYRYKIFYQDSETDYTEWTRTREPALTIQALDPGAIALDVTSVALNWKVLTSVVLELSYKHPDDPDDARIERSFELTEATPFGKWERRTHRPLVGDIDAKITYRFLDQKVLEGEPQKISVTNNLFVLPTPQRDMLKVVPVLSGVWDDVVHVLLSFEYEGDDGTSYKESYRLTSRDDDVRWEVPTKESGDQEYEYSYTVVFDNGESKRVPPVRTTNTTPEIKVPGTPKFPINIYTNMVDFARTPTVMVSIEYDGQTHAQSFTASKAVTLKLPKREDGPTDFQYEITWMLADGTEIKSGRKRSDTRDLHVLRPELPEEGELKIMFRGQLVDFDATPMVDIEIAWKDGDEEQRDLITLTKDEKMIRWSKKVTDRSQKTYHYTVTYYDADGNPLPGVSEDSDALAIVIKKHQAS